jgi:hypothetical protein
MNNNSQDPQNELLDLLDLDLLDLAEFSEQYRPIAKLHFDQEDIKALNQNQSSSDNNPSEEQNHE